MASLRSLEKVQTCSSALFHKVNSSWIYDFRKVLNDSTSFFFLEDESSLNKTAKAIGPEQKLLESMVLEENIGEEFCRDGPQIVKQNMHQECHRTLKNHKAYTQETPHLMANVNPNY